MQIIESSGLPPANGHYSQAIAHQGTLYIAGQLPIEPGTRRIPETIEEQALLVLQKLKTILNASGSSLAQTIQVRIYVSDIELWDRVNAVYSEFFGAHKPVRCVIPVKTLHYGCLIELEAVAAV